MHGLVDGRLAEALLDKALTEPERIYARDEELDAAGKILLRLLQGIVLTRAQALGLPPGYLAPKADLVRLVREGGAAPVNVLRGWRREVCGAALLNALP
ncbi:MAG: hypothetical protein AB1651_04410 [Pseudomonadota bacterium]